MATAGSLWDTSGEAEENTSLSLGSNLGREELVLERWRLIFILE